MYRNLKNVNSSFVRDVNTNLVLNAIRQNKTISRSELASLTRLSYPTVTTIIKNLMAEGFVSEGQIGEYHGGRKPVLLEFNPVSRYVIGLDLSSTNAQAVLADLDGNFLSEVIIGSQLTGETNLVAATVEVIEKLKAETGCTDDRLIGIGASLRGSFDLPNKLFYYSENETNPIRLLEGLEEHYQAPIVMDHIANVALLAEKLYGVATEASNTVFVNVGSGVSAGIMINGQIFRGFLGNAGEMGHIIIEENGPLCPDCGRRGCLENMASMYAIIGAACKEGYPFPVDLNIYQQLELLGSKAQQGDPAAQKYFARAIQGLGEGVTDLVNLLNCEVVILGGRVIRAYPEIVAAVNQIVTGQCWPFSRHNLSIVAASLSKNILLRGAISLVLNEVFISYGISVNKSVVL